MLNSYSMQIYTILKLKKHDMEKPVVMPGVRHKNRDNIPY